MIIPLSDLWNYFHISTHKSLDMEFGLVIGFIEHL
jgi:hypothetical protein